MALGSILRTAREERDLTASAVAAATNMKVQIVEDLENEDFHRIAAAIYGKGFIKLYAEYVGLDPAPLIEDYMSLVANPKPSLMGGDPTRPIRKRRVRAKRVPPSESKVADAPSAPEDEDPDLFDAAVKRRKRSTIVDETARDTDERPSKRVHAAPRGIAAIGALLVRGWNTVRSATVRWAVAGRKGVGHASESVRERFASIPFGDAPLKTIAVVIGVVVLLLFVVSGFSRCMRQRHAAADEFPMIVEIPDPYFE